MNKGKGLCGGIRLRRSTRVSINLDEEHLWEDDMLMKVEGLKFFQYIYPSLLI
jgi:hypothetical protein